MSGDIDNADILAAINQQIKATNDLCGCLTVTVAENTETGTENEQEGGEEGGDPPEGAGPKDPGIAERKCRVAEMLVTDLEQVIQNFIDNPVSFTLWNRVTVMLVIKPNLETGTLLFPLVNLKIYGWLTEWAAFLVAFTAFVDFDDMLTEVQANWETLICELNDAINPTDAKGRIAAVLAALTSQEVEMITELLFTETAYNLLWFSVGTSEDIIDAFTPTFDCDDCAWTADWDFTISDGGWTNNATMGVPYGTYVPGVGWHSVWAQHESIWDERLYMRREFDSSTITSLKVYYTITGTCGATRRHDSQYLTPSACYDELDPYPCSTHERENVCTSAAKTAVITSLVGDSSGDGAMDVTLTRAIITGTGSNPFT